MNNEVGNKTEKVAESSGSKYTGGQLKFHRGETCKKVNRFSNAAFFTNNLC